MMIKHILLHRNIFSLIFIFTGQFLLASFILISSANASDAIRKPLITVEIAKGIFVAKGQISLINPTNKGHIANLGFIIGERSVAVIDTGGSYLVGRQLIEAVRQHTTLPIKYVINTHAHPDHMLGNAAFLDLRPKFIGHKRFNEALGQRGEHYLAASQQILGDEIFHKSKLVPVDHGIADTEFIDLGNRKVKLQAFATAHTDNDLIVIDEMTNVAFLGDLLFMEHLPALDGSLTGWLDWMDTIVQQDFSLVVPGHGPASAPWPAALQAQRDYLQSLTKQLRDMIRQGVSIQQASRRITSTDKDAWALFNEFNTRNVTAGYAELEWE